MLKLVYRGKFLSALESLLEGGDLELPAGETEESAGGLLRAIARKEWNVWIEERYAHGEGVRRYLGRDARCRPISKRRLVQSTEESVGFHYHDHREGTAKQMTLSREEFIGGVLWQVPLSHGNTDSWASKRRHWLPQGHRRVDPEQCETHRITNWWASCRPTAAARPPYRCAARRPFIGGVGSAWKANIRFPIML